MEIAVEANLTLNDTYLKDVDLINTVYSARYILAIATVALAVIGLPGNITSVIVLMLPGMRNSTSTLLVILSIYDVIVIVISLFGQLHYAFSTDYNLTILTLFVFKYFYGVLHIARTGTVYMTVAITLERGLAVLFPFHAIRWCTNARALWASLIVLVWSVFYSIPRFLHFTDVTNNNLTVSNYAVEPTGIAKSFFFQKVYLVYLNSVIHFIIPIGVTFIINLSIIYRLFSRGRGTIGRANTRDDGQARLTVTIVVLTTIFIVCQFFGALETILYGYLVNGTYTAPEFARRCNLTCNVIVVLAEMNSSFNSATNFLVYIISGKKFRHELRKLCCYCKCCNICR